MANDRNTLKKLQVCTDVADLEFRKKLATKENILTEFFGEFRNANCVLFGGIEVAWRQGDFGHWCRLPHDANVGTDAIDGFLIGNTAHLAWDAILSNPHHAKLHGKGIELH